MTNDLIITKIEKIFTVHSPKGRFQKIRNRYSYGLSFCCDGRITYEQYGIKTVSDKTCAVILPKGGTYKLYGDEEGSFPVINFQCARPLCTRITALPMQNPSECTAYFEKMKSLSLYEGNNTEIMSILYHIFHILLSSEKHCVTLEPAIKFIEENYGNSDITVAYIADICNISEVYLNKLFNKHYGMSPKQFIIDIRINKAKQLLSEGKYKINAVAEMTGFSNQYHFCRMFKDKTGLTPSEYMKRNKAYKI